MRSILLVFAAAATAGAQATQVPEWTVAPRPVVEIGDDADPPKQFNRIGSVRRLADGSIVVANSGSSEIRILGPHGEYLRTISRKGQGPGELNILSQLIIAGDTIIVPDAQPGVSVVHVFSPTGFLSRVQLKAPGRGGISIVGRFSDGRYAIAPGFRALPEMPVGTMYTDTSRLGTLRLVEVATPEWIGDFPSSEIWLVDSPFVPGRPFPVDFTFGLRRARAVSGDRLWVGDSRTGAVKLFTSNGRPAGTFTAPITPRGFRTEVLERVHATQLAAATSKIDTVLVNGRYAAPRPRQVPRFTDFVPGSRGEMWVRLFEEDPAAPATFIVLNQSGHAVGRVTFPRGFTAQDIGEEYVLGVHRDEDGVEHVMEYALHRR